MKSSFCFLEKDQKTYHYVAEYYSLIEKGVSPCSFDICIQREEIEKHLLSNQMDSEDRCGISEWIEENSAKFRSYLNSIKMVALFIYFMDKDEKSPAEKSFSFDAFSHVVQLWNGRKSELIDSIFI